MNNLPDFTAEGFTAGVSEDGSYRPAWDSSFIATLSNLTKGTSNGYDVGLASITLPNGEAGTLELQAKECASFEGKGFAIGDTLLWYCYSQKSPRTQNWYGTVRAVASVAQIIAHHGDSKTPEEIIE